MNKHTHGPQGTGTRPKRVAAEIQRDLPGLIRRLVTIPEGLLVSITDVQLSADLSHAKVFFSVIGGANEELTGALVGRLLSARRGAMRSEIARLLVMRQHPELHFHWDPVPARAARIETLLKQVRDEREEREDNP
ncbi:30S ribosome-binding factor RbfA [candidate division KSB1 bacterium]|nr:30S ribosome-binding factor RbfA [candidate division KSB1 bacterium]